MSAASATAAAPAVSARKVRPFYWSLRREVWENGSVYLAPLGVAAVVLFAFLFALRHLPQNLRNIEVLTARLQTAPATPTTTAAAKILAGWSAQLAFPYAVAASGLMITAVVVAIFYSLASLNAERRDRSVLFWKSLPVSDLTTVLSKAAVPLVVLPAVTAVVVLATQVLMLAVETAVLAIAGLDPALLWDRLHLATMWTVVPYGLVVLALWNAPVVGWLMLVSAWAKRMTFIWALAPPAAICIFEMVALGSTHAWVFLRHRLVSGFEVGLSPLPPGERSVYGFERIDPAHLAANPGLWGGLVVFAACLAACVWLRRTRDPA
jgi:ABC-2 type transport system permease protein